MLPEVRAAPADPVARKEVRVGLQEVREASFPRVPVVPWGPEVRAARMALSRYALRDPEGPVVRVAPADPAAHETVR